MELMKWQTVLTEWVNCLNIIIPIPNLDELRNEELFKRLLFELTHRTKLDRDPSWTQTSITDFLKKNYPQYQLNTEPALNQDSAEITYACSLLLHYCCIIDSRSEFINILCDNLSDVSQKCITYFLEELQLLKVISRDTLKTTITKSIQKYLSLSSKTFTSPYNSPKHVKENNGSFLQDFLKTPVKKYQQSIEQHKKEIKILVDQLDIERLEKVDLQEELKTQYERNTNLEQKISAKTKEVSRLRTELLSLESESTPTDKKTKNFVEHKRLRDEIDSLEKYVGILHQEHDELRAERDSARSRLVRIEEQCKDWQGKALEAERQCSALSIEVEQQQTELAYLHEQTEELNGMLMEFRSRHLNDESYEMDSSQSDILSQNKSGIIDCESLAHTVVDVQLLEAQEENENLKKQQADLKELIRKKDSMFEDIQKKFESSQHALKESLQTNIELTKSSVNSETEILALTSKLSQTDINLAEIQSENENLYSELKLALEKCTNFVSELNDLNKKHQDLLVENDGIQIKLNNSLKEIQKYARENEAFNTTIKKFNHDMENCLLKLKSLIECKENVGGKDSFQKFDVLLRNLEQRIIKEEESKAALWEDSENLKKQLIQLGKENLTLTENESRMKTEITNLNTCLKETEDKIIHFEESVKTYKRLMDECKVMLTEKCKLIDEQRKGISQKDDLITSLSTNVSDLNKRVEQLENDFSNEQISKEKIEKTYRLMKAKCDTEISYLSEKIKEKTLHGEELQKVIDDVCEIINNILLRNPGSERSNSKDLKAYVMSLKEFLNETLVEKDGLEKELYNLNKELITFTEIYENLHQKIIHSMAQSMKNLAVHFKNTKQFDTTENLKQDSNITQSVYNKELLKIVTYITELNNKFNIVKTNIENTILDKNMVNKKIESLSDGINTLKTQKVLLHEKYNNLIYETNTKIEQLSKLSGKLQVENENLIKNVHYHQNKTVDLEEKIKKYELNMEKYQHHIVQLEQEKIDLDTRLIVSQSEQNATKSELISLQGKYEEVAKRLTNCLEAERKIKEETDLRILNLSKSQKDEINSIQNSFSKIRRDLEDTINKYKMDVEVYQRNIAQLEKENSDLIKDLKQLQVQENERNTELISTEKKLGETTKNWTLALEEMQKIKEENELNTSKVLKSHQIELNSLRNSLTVTETHLEDLTKKHQSVIDNYEKLLTNLQEKNTELENNLEVSQVRENDLKAELMSISNKIEDTKTNMIITINEKDSIIDKNKLDIDNLTKSIDETLSTLENVKKLHLEEIAKVEELKIELGQQKTSNEKLNNNIAELNSENVNIKTQMEDIINMLVSERDDLKCNIDKITKDLQGTEEMNKCLKGDLSTEKLEQIELRKRTTQLELELNEMKKKDDEGKYELSVLNDKLTNAERGKEELEIMYQQYVKNNESKLAEITENYEKELRKSKMEIDDLNFKLATIEQNIRDLEKNKEDVAFNTKSIINEKQICIEVLTDKNSELEKKIKETLQENHTLTSVLKETTTELSNLKICLENNEMTYTDNLNEFTENINIFRLCFNNIIIMLEKELKYTKENIFHKTIDTSIEVEKKYASSNTIKEQMEILKKKVAELLFERHKLHKHEKNELNKKIVDLENKDAQQVKHFDLKLESKNKELEVLERDIMHTNKIVEEKIQEISVLKTKLDEALLNVNSLENVKSNLLKSFRDIKVRVSELMQKRNELIEFHVNMAHETEERIVNIQKYIQEITNDYTKQLQNIMEEKGEEMEQKKQLETLLTSERNKSSALQKNFFNLSMDKKQIADLCSECYFYIHQLYKIAESEQTDKDDAKNSKETNGSDNTLEYLLEEKEIVVKEYSVISDEIKKLKADNLGYENLKLDYTTLINKNESLAICEHENSSLKIIQSEMAKKLADLQEENNKYQKIVSAKEDDMEGIVRERNNTYRRFEVESSLLKTTCSKLQEDIEAKEHELQEVLSKLVISEEANENLKEIEKEYDNLRQSNSEMENKLKVQERKIDHYETLLIEHKWEYCNLKELHTNLCDQNSDLISQKNDLEQKSSQYQTLISDLEAEYQKLAKRYDDLSEKHKFLVDKCSADTDNSEKQENSKLRAAYTNSMADNSRLQLDCTILRKTIEERNAQLSEMSIMKESYEKLLEDNNKAVTELDTLRYKRARDKEEFKRLLEEERNKGGSHVDARVQSVRNEYEEKLKKMKDKIVKLYKEEVDKERRKMTAEQQEYGQALETIASLKSQLWITSNKYAELKKEFEKLSERIQVQNKSHASKLRRDDIYASRESVSSVRERKVVRDVDERRLFTLPRDAKLPSSMPVDVIEESLTISRRRSITAAASSNLDQGLKMEDEEGEMFNNTYLADLKSGKCVPAGSASHDSVSRLSELQYRNSLCPPHLKSSYPAETQFTSPTQFKEDDIKTGNVDMDDSMSSSLLPNDKPRAKKDWGQTLYKKPGPPTPSKNGGRQSLQGNEVHPRDVLREHNDNTKAQTSKSTSTPNRIKALFMSKSSSQRNDSENQSTPTKGKRRSIFRLPR